MKSLTLNRICGLLLLLLISFSCASDLDYDQVNDLKIEPVFIGNLAYFDVSANKFIIGGAEQNVLFDVLIVDVFNDDFIRKSLKKVDLSFELKSTISRAFLLDLVFLDLNNQAVYSTSITIPAYTGTENIVNKTEVFENSQLDLLKRTTKIAFTLRMLPGATLTQNSSGNLILHSSVTAYLVVE